MGGREVHGWLADSRGPFVGSVGGALTTTQNDLRTHTHYAVVLYQLGGSILTGHVIIETQKGAFWTIIGSKYLYRFSSLGWWTLYRPRTIDQLLRNGNG